MKPQAVWAGTALSPWEQRGRHVPLRRQPATGTQVIGGGTSRRDTLPIRVCATGGATRPPRDHTIGDGAGRHLSWVILGLQPPRKLHHLLLPPKIDSQSSPWSSLLLRRGAGTSYPGARTLAPAQSRQPIPPPPLRGAGPPALHLSLNAYGCTV